MPEGTAEVSVVTSRGVEPAGRHAVLVSAALKALLAFNLAGLIVYEFVTYRLWFHSDAAVKNLFAEQILRTRSLFPADWVYPYGDVMVFFGHLFILPLLPFFHNGFALHAVSGTIMAALLLASVWWVTGLLSLSRPMRLLGMCLFASGVSPYFAENYYGQASYGSEAIVLLAHAGLAILAFQAVERADRRLLRRIAVALALVALVAFAASPQRAVFTYLLPLAAAVVAVLIQREWTLDRSLLRSPYVPPVSAYVAGAVLGVALHLFVLHRAVVVASAAKGGLIPFEVLGQRTVLALQSMLYLFGAAAKPGMESTTFTLLAGAPVASPHGVSLVLHLALLAAVVGGGWALARATTRDPRHVLSSAFANAFVVSLLATTFIYTLTNVGENVATSRYFVPAFTLGLVTLLAYLDYCRLVRRASIWTVVALASVLGVSLLSYESYYLPLYRAFHLAKPQSAWWQNPLEDLVAFLERNGLTYGYASFWNSHASTVLSGGKVTIRPVVYQARGLPHAFYWLSAPSWYRGAAHKGPVFFVVSSGEPFDVREMERVAGPPQKVLDYPGAKIYVYSSNFIPTWMGWDQQVYDPRVLRFSAATLHNIGAFVENSSGEGWMEASRGDAGALVYGPYIALLAGKYTVDFEVSGCSASDPSPGYVDVTASVDGRPTQLSQALIPAGTTWTRMSVPFELARYTEGIEFRVLASGAQCLRARSVTLRRAQ